MLTYSMEKQRGEVWYTYIDTGGWEDLTERTHFMHTFDLNSKLYICCVNIQNLKPLPFKFLGVDINIIHMTKYTRSSPSDFVCCEWSKTGRFGKHHRSGVIQQQQWQHWTTGFTCLRLLQAEGIRQKQVWVISPGSLNPTLPRQSIHISCRTDTVEPLYNGHLWGLTFCPL